METKKINIPDYKFEGFKKSFEKLVKRANKLNVAPPGYKILDPIERQHKDFAGEYIVTFIPVEISGNAPCFDGWHFRSTLEYTKSGNIIKSVPGFEAPEKYRQSHQCDHCRTKRNRKHTFLVEHDSGDLKQVGRTCIKDFLGHAAPEQIANYWASIAEIYDEIYEDDFEYTGEKMPRKYDIKSVLAIGCAAIQKYGWTSKKQEFESYGQKLSTAWDVHDFIGKSSVKQKTNFEISPEDREKSNKVYAWIDNYPEEKIRGSYFWNLKIFLDEKWISWDNMPTLVSAIACYDREQEKKAIETADIKSGHFGEIKKRYDLQAKIVSRRTWEHQYGVGEIVKMVDKEGHGFTWFASKTWSVETEGFFTIKATVKAHSEYQGAKQTIITRVKG